MLKHTPLHSQHVALGARMAPFAGFDMPVQYSGIIDEHLAVRQNAGLFDVSHMGEVMIRGAKALDFVQHLVTNDISSLYDGKALYTVMCRPDGGIIDDLLVYRFSADEYMLVINAGNTDEDLAWMREQAMDGADIVDVSSETALIAIQGPKALDIAADVSGIDVHDIKPYHFVQADDFLGFKDVVLSHTGYTGERGLEIYCPPAAASYIWEKLLESGRSSELRPCGLGARDTLRIESGFVLYGNDISEDTHPLEAGLGWLVKPAKGDFIGRDAIETIREQGVDRKLIGFILQERGIPREGLPIADEDGREIGVVTSGTQSAVLKQGIGLGYVENDPRYTEPSSSIRILNRGRMLEALVARPPFHKKRA